MRKATLTFAFLGLAGLGCASKPPAPFDTLKSVDVIAFRLQNFEPPAATPVAPAAGGAIPGIPPEILALGQQMLPGLQALLPPGLLPPGMVPGAAPSALPAPNPQAPRFPMGQPNFRILGQTHVIDAEIKEQLSDLFGDEDNFQAAHANCMYAEMGLSLANPANPQMPNDLLISISCNQVEARSFAWPYPNRGLKPDAVKQIAAIAQKIWPS